MPGSPNVSFISVTPPNASTELNPAAGTGLDADFIIRYARALDDYGYTHTLIGYGSSGPDPFTIGPTIIANTKNIKVVIALRPNTIYPTVAAKALSTLDHLSKGRVGVHFMWANFVDFCCYPLQVVDSVLRWQCGRIRRRSTERRRFP